MSDVTEIYVKLTTNNPLLLKQSFDILKTYLEEEYTISSVLSVIPQLTSLIENINNHSEISSNFLEDKDCRNLKNKIKFLSSYSEVKPLLLLLDKENINLFTLKKDLDSAVPKQLQQHLSHANAYLSFCQTLQSSLADGQWENIKKSWNENYTYFDSEKITFSNLASLFPHDKLSTEISSQYVKFIKHAQEKIAQTLYQQFLIHPEDSEKLSKSCPDFFQFFNWLHIPSQSCHAFASLLEQKHWNSLIYASKISGLELFLDKFLLNNNEKVLDFDPFEDNQNGYSFFNLDILKIINQKNVNIDVVLKNNTIGMPKDLRGYFYQKIELLEKGDKKHSQNEFNVLDKLLTVYEKQKFESIYVAKNIKTKTNKI